jgi:hypothetical protein
MPGTPPELFLVTRDTPNISQDLWQNFQPDQLFPADSNIVFPTFSPGNQQQASLVDPQLQQGMVDTSGASMTPQHTVTLPQHHNDPNAWAQQLNSGGGAGLGAPGNDETWSNSSKGTGAIVPTTLNVEDWYVVIFVP